MKKQILIVEDEKHLAEALAHNLQFEGYATTQAHDGEQGLQLASSIKFDLILLDIMMPKLDGLEVCRRIRAAENRVPILFLTARASDADRLLGLKVGADDYIPKPFLLEELILRIQGIFRRQDWYSSPPEEKETYTFGNNQINFRTYAATASGSKINLTEKECMLMKLLIERRDQVVSREEILERVWGYRFSTSSRTIDNFIVRLRRYFEDDPKNPVFIHSVRGVGYRFSADNP
jgi:two-component system alkaline phosphatase synthesis response regulator PhoP